MGYKFDQNLIQRVLADPGFRSTGKHVGFDGRYYYAVIDPRRHNINVWTKPNDASFAGTDNDRYRKAAKRNAGIVATNGPPMEPPAFPGEGFVSGENRIRAGFVYSAATGTPWEPYDSVLSGGQQLHAGRGNVKWHFARTAEGSLAAYRIAQGTATGVEVLNGCYGIVSGGARVQSPDHDGLIAKSGCAVWCRRPLANPLATPDWRTEVDWLPGATDDNGVARPLDGLIVAVGVNWKPRGLAEAIIRVGCTEAVAMDGSTSAVFAIESDRKVDCEFEKDLVQRWGLFCT